MLVITHRTQKRHVQKALRPLGRFTRSGFRDVLKGDVENIEAFLEQLAQQPTLPVSRVIPLDDAFPFQPETLLEQLQTKLSHHLDRLAPSTTFSVRMERRGLRHILSSQHVETALGRYLQEQLQARTGRAPQVDLDDPDTTVVIQTLGRLAGLALLSKEFRKRYPLVRLK